MKRFILTALVLTAISTAVWSIRKQELTTLRAETARAREQRAQAELSRKQSAAELAEGIDANEAARLRALRPELARLRGSIGALRARTNQTPEQLHAQAEKVLGEAMLIRARLDAQKKSEAAGNSLGTCLWLATYVAEVTDGTLPQTWDDVRSRLSQTTEGEPPVLAKLRRMFEGFSAPDGAMKDFEIIPRSAEIRVRRGEPRAEIPLLREREPRPQPDGGFVRYYAWLNGRVEAVLVKDGNFEVWERENLKAAAAKPAGQ